jgi:hypothetical protein
MNLDWINTLPNIKQCKTFNRYSQHGEEVVLKKIFEQIGTTNQYFVDYGAGDGYNLSNTRALKELGWTGLAMDGFYDTPEVKKEFITPKNIVELYKKYEVPSEFDLLSQDLDSCDFHLLQHQINHYKPRVIICEFNPYFQDESVYLAYEEGYTWDGTDKYGFSFECGKKWGMNNGYSLVYENGCNLIFIKNEILGGYKDFNIQHSKKIVHPHNPNAKWLTY